MPAATTEIDGRRLRREQNRAAVVDALVGLLRAGNLQPGTAEIAERAGVSSRSLYRYFDDVDDLNRTAIDRLLSDARPLADIAVGVDDPTERKITAVVEARVHLFDAFEPAARAARILADRNVIVAAQLARGRRQLREQLERLFAPELLGSPVDRLPAIDALCSFETHQLLRVDQGLTSDETAAALIDALSTLLPSKPSPLAH